MLWIAVALPLSEKAAAQTGIAASVGDEQIKIERLQLQVDMVLKKTPATGTKLDIIKAQVLEENIKQRLVNLYLQNSKYKATTAEVNLELVNLKKDLQERKLGYEEFLKQKGISEEQLQQSLGWDLAWAKYLDNFLTDNNLNKYFEKHRKQFDGTELRVAHVLLKPDDPTKRDSWEKAYGHAKAVYADIASEKLTFEKAVIEYSSGATKINKGELGWINWRGPMAREFTFAAFRLRVGEVSQPTQTGFGFHLIKLLEEKPGMKTVDDVRPQVVQSVKRYLFEWLASKQAKQSKINFTGEFPYFEYGTKKLGKFKS